MRALRPDPKYRGKSGFNDLDALVRPTTSTNVSTIGREYVPIASGFSAPARACSTAAALVTSPYMNWTSRRSFSRRPLG
jgi:hypothetical protein